MSLPPIDFNGLDTAVHGPIRLGVLTALQIDGVLDFTTLRKRLDVADGALGIHLQKLEEAGYVAAHKAFVGRRPRTTYRISPGGRKALNGYLESMQKLIDAVDSAQGKDER
ncbi:MAG: transcriptional regulator [Planctomycetota bacterium]|nr:transcriptional regulator [Planctomycetota bacterium]